MTRNCLRMRTAIIPAALALAALTGCVSYKVQHDGIARAGLSETVYVDGPKVTPVESDRRTP